MANIEAEDASADGEDGQDYGGTDADFVSSQVFPVFCPKSRAEERGFAYRTTVLVSGGGSEIGEET
jgi:hypothetical protein